MKRLLIVVICMGMSILFNNLFAQETIETETFSIKKKLLCGNDALSSTAIDFEVTIPFEQAYTMDNYQFICSSIVSEVSTQLNVQDVLNGTTLYETIENIADRVLKNNREEIISITKNNNDFTLQYEHKIVVSPLLLNQTYACLKIEISEYTGGAHNNYVTKFLNLDLKNQTYLKKSDLFQTQKNSEIRHIIMKSLLDRINTQKGLHLHSEKDLGEYGIWDLDKLFDLAEVSMTSDNIIFYYNTYSIACFAEGPISLSIPKNKLTKYLTTIPLTRGHTN